MYWGYTCRSDVELVLRDGLDLAGVSRWHLVQVRGISFDTSINR